MKKKRKKRKWDVLQFKFHFLILVYCGELFLIFLFGYESLTTEIWQKNQKSCSQKNL